MTSIRVDEQLWNDFVAWCHDRRTSTCHVIEPLVYALMKGSSEAPPLQALPKVTMSLSVTREVARPRRAVDREGQPVFEDWGSHVSCHFCKRPTRWVVYYSPGWDKTVRVYCCGYHVKRYRRMTSLVKGYPNISIQGVM